MEYIHDRKEIALSGRNVVSIGKFDGFHLGHQKLIREMRALAAGEDCRTVLLTFDTSPQAFMNGGPADVLTSREEKPLAAEKLGVDVLVDYPFDDQVRHMEAETFLREVILKGLGAAEIIVGTDCRFGYMGRGTTALLQELTPRFGCGLTVVEKVLYERKNISSTRIRESITAGRIREANAMLGYPYSITSSVLHGEGFGRTIGFPTINQICEGRKVMPAFGVYRTRVWIDGADFDAMTYVGVKPTFGHTRPGIETHILNYEGDLYGRTLRVEFLDYVRPERKFDGESDLMRQLWEDRNQIVRYING